MGVEADTSIGGEKTETRPPVLWRRQAACAATACRRLASRRPHCPSLALPIFSSQTAAMPKTELEKRFAKAVWLIRNGPPKEGTSNDEKLQFYGYFKQATEGDCTAPQPWAGAAGWGGLRLRG